MLNVLNFVLIKQILHFITVSNKVQQTWNEWMNCQNNRRTLYTLNVTKCRVLHSYFISAPLLSPIASVTEGTNNIWIRLMKPSLIKLVFRFSHLDLHTCLIKGYAFNRYSQATKNARRNWRIKQNSRCFLRSSVLPQDLNNRWKSMIGKSIDQSMKID